MPVNKNKSKDYSRLSYKGLSVYTKILTCHLTKYCVTLEPSGCGQVWVSDLPKLWPTTFPSPTQTKSHGWNSKRLLESSKIWSKSHLKGSYMPSAKTLTSSSDHLSSDGSPLGAVFYHGKAGKLRSQEWTLSPEFQCFTVFLQPTLMGYLALAGHPVEAHVPFRFQIRYGKRAHLYMFFPCINDDFP